MTTTTAERAYKKQRDRVRARELESVRARIPHDCPLVVTAKDSGGQWRYSISPLSGPVGPSGVRYEVALAWIDGFIRAWEDGD